MTPVEAAALIAACGLPSWVLTDPDPVDIARRLAGLRTGMLEEDVRYEPDAQARYEYTYAIDSAATRRVRDRLIDAGWDVTNREHGPRWGADLAVIRSEGVSREQRPIEVKGKGRANWSGVVLQQSPMGTGVRVGCGRRQRVVAGYLPGGAEAHSPAVATAVSRMGAAALAGAADPARRRLGWTAAGRLHLSLLRQRAFPARAHRR